MLGQCVTFLPQRRLHAKLMQNGGMKLSRRAMHVVRQIPKLLANVGQALRERALDFG